MHQAKTKMGQQASRLWRSLVIRPSQRYAVEHRAEKVITKIADPAEKPIRAPMFKSDADLLEKIRQTQPTVAAAAHRKDDHHHDRLRDVFVTSEDPMFEGDPGENNPDRPMPIIRVKQYADNIPAALRRTGPDVKVKRGKVDINTAIEFLSKRKEKGIAYTAQDIAEEHKLNPETVANVLQYFAVFTMHTPVPKEDRGPRDALEAGEDWVVYNKDHVKAIKTGLKKEKGETRRQLTESEIEIVRGEEKKLNEQREKVKKLDR